MTNSEAKSHIKANRLNHNAMVLATQLKESRRTMNHNLPMATVFKQQEALWTPMSMSTSSTVANRWTQLVTIYR